MSNVTVDIRIGSNSKTFDAKNIQQLGGFFLQSILGEAGKDVVNAVQFNLSKLSKSLALNVENSYLSAVQFAANSMINLRSPKGAANRQGMVDVRGPRDEDGSDTIAHWKPLAPRTIREQNSIKQEKSSGRFFSQYGNLRHELLGTAKRIVKSTGVVRVVFNKQSGRRKIRETDTKVHIADFKIIVMPNIGRSVLPALGRNVRGFTLDQQYDSSLTFEKKLGISDASIRKLRGAGSGNFVIPGTHRPLLQPVFTYWTLNKIPRVIANSLDRAISRGPKINNSSGQVFTQV